KGFIFLYKRLIRNKSFLIGAILFVLIQMISSCIIWDIKIIGNNEIPLERIVRDLEILGVKNGVFKHKIDQKHVVNNLILENPKIAWVGMQIKGSKIFVTIVEKDKVPKLDDDEFCDIVALKGGIIDDILVLDGEGLVSKGEMVRKGQILISGMIKEDEKVIRLAQAKGEVRARIFHNKKIDVPLIQIKKVETGLTSKITKLKVDNYEIPIKRNGQVFDNYRLETERKTILRWRNKKPIIELITEKYYELNEEKVFIGVEKAFEIGKNILEKEMTKTIKGNFQIVNKNFEKRLKEDDNIVEVGLTVETIERIDSKGRILQVE
ncbi:MAG TPA: sporulation protein YqfD, partial [Thermoanaerobacterales bacterium]|nr:sporulation protein YqfD [Thermoanaerobacterales bacterium]